MATTKQDVADFINDNVASTLTPAEIDKIDAILTPETAEILIKLLGDVSFLVNVRDNGSN